MSDIILKYSVDGFQFLVIEISHITDHFFSKREEIEWKISKKRRECRNFGD